MRHESEAAQLAAATAADTASSQLTAARSENRILAAALDKERAAFAANGAMRNEAVWKGRLVRSMLPQCLGYMSHILGSNANYFPCPYSHPFGPIKFRGYSAKAFEY